MVVECSHTVQERTGEVIRTVEELELNADLLGGNRKGNVLIPYALQMRLGIFIALVSRFAVPVDGLRLILG